jgi:hypothetical protein
MGNVNEYLNDMAADWEIPTDIIEAGEHHLVQHDPEFGVDAEDTVVRIFLEMLRRAPEPLLSRLRVELSRSEK